jgi:hypothetical protein
MFDLAALVEPRFGSRLSIAIRTGARFEVFNTLKGVYSKIFEPLLLLFLINPPIIGLLRGGKRKKERGEKLLPHRNAPIPSPATYTAASQ